MADKGNNRTAHDQFMGQNLPLFSKFLRLIQSADFGKKPSLVCSKDKKQGWKKNRALKSFPDDHKHASISCALVRLEIANSIHRLGGNQATFLLAVVTGMKLYDWNGMQKGKKPKPDRSYVQGKLPDSLRLLCR